ncbi:alpha/beta hydrolase [Lactobacillus taiwanensis]|uniref:alpha/beta hydrolase n=1 Tax=Lactobacillus taiwanensis TaxID=508451 RepID=UPI000B97D3A0|nr:alpha/beta hydrolase [Lactobacillus taiwanensis]OYR95439.1 alpha/beta hydrolase [Lactobacillus taiwanensis]OYS00786.1 alpha/beta hydrolase [Lactobacillus taiwanensis]OYS16975.1 alpha/beta hydrolase [Lactobacillus taiwanensis]OYS31986.1 alpha/beta hydrolase [Lactobacillus taiwanensis]OYS32019.1 alpha/beta hydrolase [Lactobacillus taiwanensis]
MKKKNLFALLMTSILLILAGCSSQDNTSSKKVQITSTPTLFFHGGGSSYHAEEHMVDAAKKAGVTKSVIRAEVSKTGKVTLVGTWPKNAKNPICEVNYENNRQLNFNKQGEYAANVVKALQKKYGIKKINMVGHSLGNISIIYYMLQNGNKKNMPQIQKQVDITGHFAGLDFDGIPSSIKQPKGMKLNSNGKPNRMNSTYKQMTEVRSIYAKKHVKVLNIIGDIGNGSDGRVDNKSSLSLQYLVRGGNSTYRILKINGKNAQHSKLHENVQVDKALIKFLWNK